jgi:hypothetical protein
MTKIFNRHILIKRLREGTAFALAFALMFSFVPVSRSSSSLPHIEVILQGLRGGKTFNILEVVPGSGDPGIGIYIDGQEPGDSGSLADELAKIDSRGGREDYFDRVLRDFGEKLGDSDATPLRRAGAYNEVYPWEVSGSASGWTRVDLEETETANLSGSLVPDDNGVFDVTSDMQFQIGGDYRHEYYTNVTEEQAEGRYYTLEFKDDPFFDGSEVVPTDGDYYYLLIEGEDADYYEYFGRRVNGRTIGRDGRNINFTATGVYYILSSITTTTEWNDDAVLYVGAGNYVYLPDGTGFFVQFVKGAAFVGPSGKYGLVPGDGTVDVDYKTVYYQGGFVNNNWFIRHVFDTVPANNINIAVSSVLASELNQSDYVHSADLIVLVDNGNSSSNDLSADAAGWIYSAVINNGTPAIVERGLIDKTQTAAGRLARLLVLYSDNEGYIADGGTPPSIASLPVGSFVTTEIVNDKHTKGNVFCYDSEVANVGFPVYITTPAVGSGLWPVLDEIQHENILRTNKLSTNISPAKAVRYIISFAGQRKRHRWESITVLAIQPSRGRIDQPVGLTNSAGTLLTGGANNITASARLNKDTALKDKVWRWIGQDGWGDAEKTPIEIVTMSTYEFIGKIEDLNQKYHMIYIGADTEGMRMRNSLTNYLDTDMNGLIYSNIGDLQGVGTAGWNWANDMQTLTGSGNQYRLSGNDLTRSKMAEIASFAKTGYPVVISDELAFGSGRGITIHSNRVDVNSYMHKTLTEIIGAQDEVDHNVFTETGAENAPNQVNNQLQLSKPNLHVTASPPPYVEGNTSGVLAKGANGATMTFRFTIDNQREDPGTTYNVQLFIDDNGDGLINFELKGLRVSTEGGASVPRDGNRYALTSGVSYVVTRQLTYNMVGLFPWSLRITQNDNDGIRTSIEGFTRIPVGMDAEGNRQTIKINILQIASSSTEGWNGAEVDQALNLERQQVVSTTTNANFLGEDGLYYTGVYGKYIADVAHSGDFDINIITVYTNELHRLAVRYSDTSSLGRFLGEKGITLSAIASNNADDLFKVFDAFDMLILGFDDSWGSVALSGVMTEAAANVITTAVKAFIETNKAVLMTHDVTALSNATGNLGHHLNRELRGPTLLDRHDFHNTQSNPSLDSYVPNLVGNRPMNNGQGGVANLFRHGFTNYLIKFVSTDSNYPITGNNTLLREGRLHSLPGLSQLTGNSDIYAPSTVSRVNTGKITRYPYNIEASSIESLGSEGAGHRIMSVQPTHFQWYQLNMNAKNIFVWYTLESSAYIKNDVVNAYYIYNAGNITYSGAGHSARQNQMTTGFNGLSTAVRNQIINEVKLFINTMIAAYRPPPADPELVFLSQDGRMEISTYLLPSDLKAGDTEGVYTWDSGVFGDFTYKVPFKVLDDNPDPDKKITLTEMAWFNGEGDINDEDSWESFGPQLVYRFPNGTVQQTELGTEENDIYYFYLPQWLLDEFEKYTSVFIRLTITNTTTGKTSGTILPILRVGMMTMW